MGGPDRIADATAERAPSRLPDFEHEVSVNLDRPASDADEPFATFRPIFTVRLSDDESELLLALTGKPFEQFELLKAFRIAEVHYEYTHEVSDLEGWEPGG